MNACLKIHDEATAVCVKIEREFLSHLMGGCSTPISAFAKLEGENIVFKGNIVSPDGSAKAEISEVISHSEMSDAGKKLAEKLLVNGGKEIAEAFKKDEK